MIKIDRLVYEKPACLEPTPPPTSKTYQKVRKDLWQMQKGKCCYCEMEVPESGQSAHIEHYRPKGKPEFEHLTNEWTNLLLACPGCNGAKHNEFPLDAAGHPLIIDPSDDDTNPEDHLEYYVNDMNENEKPLLGQIRPANDDVKGDKTIEVLKLDSSFNKKRRKKKLREARRYVLDYIYAEDEDSSENAVRSISQLAKDESEYAGLVRYLARIEGIALN